MIFCFSGTGNSNWVAQSVGKALGDTVTPIGQYFATGACPKPIFGIAEDEKIGFVFPIHSWGIPPIVAKFINALQIKNYSGQEIYCIMTCGDECGYADKMLLKIFAEKSWTCRHIYSLSMPNNYVCIKGFGTDPTEVAEQKKQKAKQNLPRLIEAIKTDNPISFYNKSNHFAFLKSRMIYPLFAKWAINDKPFVSTDKCTSCGLCAKVCPVKNITLNNGKPQWNGNCTQCLACLHHCPTRAIEYGKASVNEGRYIYKD